MHKSMVLRKLASEGSHIGKHYKMYS